MSLTAARQGANVPSQPTSMLARDGRNIMFSMLAPILDLFAFGRNGRGRIIRLSIAHGGQSVGNMGWSGRSHDPPLLVR